MGPRRRGAAEAMLGTEYLHHRDSLGKQGVDEVGAVDNGGLVGHHGDIPTQKYPVATLFQFKKTPAAF